MPTNQPTAGSRDPDEAKYRDHAASNPGPRTRAIFSDAVPGIAPDAREFDDVACVRLKRPKVDQYGAPKRGA